MSYWVLLIQAGIGVGIFASFPQVCMCAKFNTALFMVTQNFSGGCFSELHPVAHCCIEFFFCSDFVRVVERY
jgi:hypothetical protein